LGGSVGIGALIVGVALMGVFVIANSSINSQMEASLDAIDAADNPLPSITFVDANLDEDAILEFDIDGTSPGQGYVGDGVIECSANCALLSSGFWATYDVNGLGEVISVSIESHGVGYSGGTVPTLTISGDSGTITQTAVFNNLRRGNALFGNLTNDGSVAIDVGHMWISADGDAPDELSPDHYNTFETFFPSEVIPIVYLQGGSSGTVTSLSVTGFGAVASIGV